MAGYLPHEREARPPMNREQRIGSAVMAIGALLCVLFTLATVNAFPALLGGLHGKVSPAMPVMWFLGGMFVIRAGVNSPGERRSPRTLRLFGWGIVAMSTVAMILPAVL